MVVMLIPPPLASAQLAQNNPRLALPASGLHRQYEDPIFITGHVGVGGGFQYDQGQLAYGASLVFRPGSALNFLDFLAPLNAAMVLRLDHQQLTSANRIYSGDLVVRRYFANRGDDRTDVLPFFSFGGGASDVTLPADEGGGNARYWSWLLAAGQEWFFKPDIVVVARVQYRRFSYGAAFVSTWSVTGAVGLPIPW